MSHALPSEAPLITVVICTRNRADQLAGVLDSLALQTAPANVAWELCLVDNGSTDHTRQVVESYSARIRIRYVREDTPGLSNARNRGVEEARGRYICWTDDDVRLEPGWLEAYAEAFRQYPDAVVFGGRVLPVLEGPTPHWFETLQATWPVSSVLAARDLGDEPIPLSFNGNLIPYGANYAVRTAEQRRLRYDPKLGVSPQQRRLGEETEMMFHLFRNGAKGWWVPGATVLHLIPTKRQSWAYILEYFTAMGETMAYLEATSPGANHMQPNPELGSAVAASGLVLRRRLVMANLRYALARMSRSPLKTALALRQIGLFRGALAYRMRQ